MSIAVLKRAGLFIAYVLVQAMVLGRIHLFGFATPLLYVYFVVKFPRNYPKWGILLWSFSLGLAIDIFCNTPGVAAGALTLIGALQPYIFQLFVPRDSVDDLVPAIRTIGLAKFAYYVTILVLAYCIVFFSLETFSYFDIVEWMMCVFGSAVFTLALIMTFESVRG